MKQKWLIGKHKRSGKAARRVVHGSYNSVFPAMRGARALPTPGLSSILVTTRNSTWQAWTAKAIEPTTYANFLRSRRTQLTSSWQTKKCTTTEASEITMLSTNSPPPPLGKVVSKTSSTCLSTRPCWEKRIWLRGSFSGRSCMTLMNGLTSSSMTPILTSFQRQYDTPSCSS